MSDYGDFLAKALGGTLISYESYGGYSGDFVAIIEKGSDWHIYKGRYGSCSGCDWLCDTRLYSDADYERYENNEIDSEELERCEILQSVKDDYLEAHSPFLVLPKSQIPDTLEEFISLLPANTRTEYDAEEEDEYNKTNEDFCGYAKIFANMKNFKMDNLKYLEQKLELGEQNGN